MSFSATTWGRYFFLFNTKNNPWAERKYKSPNESHFFQWAMMTNEILVNFTNTLDFTGLLEAGFIALNFPPISLTNCVHRQIKWVNSHYYWCTLGLIDGIFITHLSLLFYWSLPQFIVPAAMQLTIHLSHDVYVFLMVFSTLISTGVLIRIGMYSTGNFTWIFYSEPSSI